MYKRLFKRLIDIITAIICLPFLLVIFIFAAPLIKLADKGPIFYNAERIGKDGELFKMYKFRSMMVNAPDIRLADGSTYNGADDPRVTGIGKFLRKTSLDEAPQILNVLIGNMSLIGPRPDPPDWIDKYPEEIKVFLSVRPGITGYSQAYFRNSADGEEKMKNDAFYAENCSFFLDAEIFLKTIVIVLKRENTFKDVSNEQLFNVGESTLCKDNKKGNVSAEVI
jgi:undecaprenyl phosphate N,N'-diacetylbacillosamine 1-phosphate transferase